MEFLIWFVLIVASLTLVGHGLWIFFAWVIRALFGPSTESWRTAVRDEPERRAPRDLTAAERRRIVLAELSMLRADGKLSDDLYESVFRAYQNLETSGASEPQESKEPVLPPPLPQAGAGMEWDADPAPSRSGIAEPLEDRPEPWDSPVAAASLPPPLPVEPPPPREPDKPWTEILAAFMESKHIRWGELIGGMLIVLCSAALVISFWSAISDVPLLKFGLFTGITAAIFGCALFMEHRWELPTTSRGVLVTASLLVPLNFLAMAAFAGSGGGAAALLGKSVALVVFAVLLFFGAKVLTPRRPRAFPLSLLGAAFPLLVLGPGSFDTGGDWRIWIWGLVPVASFVAGTIIVLHRYAQDDELDGPTVSAWLTLAGTVFCTALLTVGFVVYQSGNSGASLRILSPLLCTLSLPVLAGGLWMWQKPGSKPEHLRLTGTSLTIFGAVIIGLCGVLSLPSTASMAGVAGFGFVILFAVAWRFHLRVAHVAAAACLTVFLWLVAQCAWGNLPVGLSSIVELASVLFGGRNPGLYFIVIAALAGTASALRRCHRSIDALYYLVAAAVVAFWQLLLLTFHGFGRADDHGALYYFAFYTLAAFSIAVVWKRVIAGWLGWVVLLVVLIQGLVYHTRIAAPWSLVFAVSATLALAGAIWAARFPKWGAALIESGRTVSLAASLALAASLVGLLDITRSGLCSNRAFWLSGLWLVMAIRDRSVTGFRGFQVALAVGVLSAINWYCYPLIWAHKFGLLYQHPAILQAYAAGLILLGSLFLTMRLALRPGADDGKGGIWKILHDLLSGPGIKLDRLMAWIPMLGMLAMILLATACRWWQPGSYQPWAASALGAGSVAVLLATGIFLAAGLWEEWKSRTIPDLVIVAMGILIWVANACSSQADLVLWLRWTATLACLFISALVWSRNRLAAWAAKFSWPGFASRDPGLPKTLEILVAAVPALLVMASTGDWRIWHNRELFQAVGPLVLMVATVVGFGFRERSPGRLLAAGLLANFTVSAGFRLAFPIGGSTELVRFFLLNILTVGLFVMGWRLLEKLGIPESGLRRLYARAGFLPGCLLMLAGMLNVVLFPDRGPAWLAPLAGPVSWAAMIAGAAAVRERFALLKWRDWPVSFVTTGGLLVTGFVVCGLGSGPQPAWASYHSLVSGLFATQLLLLGSGLSHACDPEFDRRKKRVLLLVAASLCLAFRGYAQDPTGPAFMIAAVFGSTAILSGLAWLAGSRTLAYFAACGLVVSGELWWMRGVWFSGTNTADLLNISVLGLGMAAALSRPLERKLSARSDTPAQALPPLPDGALAFNLAVLSLLLLARLWTKGTADYWPANAWLTWSALVITAAIAVARCWNPASPARGAALYLIGILSVLTALAQPDYRPARFAAGAVFAFGGYQLVCSAIWRWRMMIERALHLPSMPEKLPRFLEAGQSGLAAAEAFAVLFLVLGGGGEPFSFLWRFGLGAGIFLPALALGWLVPGSSRDMRSAALALLVPAVLAMSWSFTAPGSPADLFLNRLAVMLVVIVVLLGVFRFWAARGTGNLRAPIARVMRRLIMALGICLAVILGAETIQRVSGRSVSMDIAAVIVVGLCLVGIASLFVCFALVPDFDPLRLNDSKRMRYVYAAEAALALVLVHLRLALPWLFDGFLTAYWPFVIMALAFSGVATGELFRRKGALILAEPLERTGLFLPLLPVAGFWAAGSDSSYPGLLFLVGLLYGVLAVMRRSFGFGLLAALAGNAGLWFVLAGMDGLRFFQHPQLWLIPVALSVLIAAHLNRANLNARTMTTIRYLSLMLIYVSSSADLFINGVGSSLWLPLILGALCVGGVFLGIALRVRAFLYLGAGFLLLDLLAVIRHASDNMGWTWIWYIAGIGLGLAIIALFAVFEKKRTAMLTMLDNLQSWEK